ncbi:MAG: 30S ribosomal protein S8 [Desulfovibrionaceae bacterium]|nr:30S ribosomal protein S8 [Desulfovibrionaceae bacterium]
MMTDPIADMLTRIRNAHLALHKEVNVPRSKMKEAIASILKQEGYVSDVTAEDRTITIQLKYHQGKAAIEGLKRVSKPGRRKYVGVGEIPNVQNGLGICILSTSRGVMDGASAREASVGGELLCEIW